MDLRLVKCTVSALSSSPVLGKAAVHCLRTMYCPWHDTGARGLGMRPYADLGEHVVRGRGRGEAVLKFHASIADTAAGRGSGRATLLGTVSHIPALRVRHLEKHLRSIPCSVSTLI